MISIFNPKSAKKNISHPLESPNPKASYQLITHPSLPTKSKACLGMEKGNQTKDHQSTIGRLTQIASHVCEQQYKPFFEADQCGISLSPKETKLSLL
jgi:hypothetical protein